MSETQLYRLDRYVNNKPMAQGAAVYAADEKEAVEKAVKLFESDARPGEMARTRFEIRR